MSDYTPTAVQQKVLEARLRCQSNNQAAKELGLSRQYVDRTLKRLEKNGAVPWFTPAVTPDHLKCVKSTVQYDAAGRPVQEWKRLVPTLDQLNDIVEGLCEKVHGKAKVPVRKARKTDTDDILFELDIYDAHVGMYADEKETLDGDYDCDIAAKRMVEAAQGICSRANRPGKVVVVFGGDMLHADNRSNTTEASGNVLDVDTRYSRVVGYVIAACTDVIGIAASVGAAVDVVILEGNHSHCSEIWLARVLHAYFSNCPNVNVQLCASLRKHMVFGENLLVWAHGDKIASQKWAQIIAAEFSKQWGITKFRHLKCGHIHHQKSIAPVIVDEQAGLLVEFLPALCATDAWHASAGFVGNQRGAVGFEYHKDLGCVTRFFQPV